MCRLPNHEYLLNKARPNLAHFSIGLRHIQGCQVLCRVLVGAFSCLPHTRPISKWLGTDLAFYWICSGQNS